MKEEKKRIEKNRNAPNASLAHYNTYSRGSPRSGSSNILGIGQMRNEDEISVQANVVAVMADSVNIR